MEATAAAGTAVVVLRDFAGGLPATPLKMRRALKNRPVTQDSTATDSVYRAAESRPAMRRLRWNSAVPRCSKRCAPNRRLRRDAGGQQEDDVRPGTRAPAGRLVAATAPSLKRSSTPLAHHPTHNLGRAPLARAAVDRVAALSGYTNLEYDLDNGGRGRRDVHAEQLLCRLTGAEAAVVVNNNAAATLLTLAALAAGREVIVSRGELVEIGGGFRIPDVMRQSGAMLRERHHHRTRAADYATAIYDRTARCCGGTHPNSLEASRRQALGDLVNVARRSCPGDRALAADGSEPATSLPPSPRSHAASASRPGGGSSVPGESCSRPTGGHHRGRARCRAIEATVDARARVDKMTTRRSKGRCINAAERAARPSGRAHAGAGTRRIAGAPRRGPMACAEPDRGNWLTAAPPSGGGSVLVPRSPHARRSAPPAMPASDLEHAASTLGSRCRATRTTRHADLRTAWPSRTPAARDSQRAVAAAAVRGPSRRRIKSSRRSDAELELRSGCSNQQWLTRSLGRGLKPRD